MSHHRGHHSQILTKKIVKTAPHVQYSPQACLLATAPTGAEKETAQLIAKAEHQQVRMDLLAYCGLETDAMVKIASAFN